MEKNDMQNFSFVTHPSVSSLRDPIEKKCPVISILLLVLWPHRKAPVRIIFMFVTHTHTHKKNHKSNLSCPVQGRILR